MPLDPAMGLLQLSVPRRALCDVLDACEQRVRDVACKEGALQRRVDEIWVAVEEVAEARLHDVVVRWKGLIVCCQCLVKLAELRIAFDGRRHGDEAVAELLRPSVALFVRSDEQDALEGVYNGAARLVIRLHRRLPSRLLEQHDEAWQVLEVLGRVLSKTIGLSDGCLLFLSTRHWRTR